MRDIVTHGNYSNQAARRVERARRTGPGLAALAAVLFVALLPGCLASKSVTAEEFDQRYQPTADIWPQSRPPAVVAGQRPSPSVFIMAEETELLPSILSITEAVRSVRAGDQSVHVVVADNMAAYAANDLRALAERITALGQAAESYPYPSGRERWARDVSTILGFLYRLDRGPAVADPRDQMADDLDGKLAALVPLLRSVIMRAMQQVPGEIDPRQPLISLSDQPTMALQLILEAAFRLARLEMPAEAPGEVLKLFANGPPTALGMQASLRGLLLELRDRAERDPRPEVTTKVEGYLGNVPRMIRVAARVMEQWPSFCLVGVETGELGDGRKVVSVLLDIKPGRTVRLDNIFPMAPVLTMEGRTRISYWTSQQGPAKETHVQFASERGGRVAIRFEAFVYDLAGLLTFPLEDWSLREIVTSRTPLDRHRWRSQTTVLMTSADPRLKGDPRRLLVLSEERRLEVRTNGEQVDRLVHQESKFEFLTSNRLWYRDSSKVVALPKP